jgi:DNA-directed RNA polymerase subunit F
LLDEVNVVYSKQRKQFTDDEATQLIDMNFAKKVMKSMNSEQ